MPRPVVLLRPARIGLLAALQTVLPAVLPALALAGPPPVHVVFTGVDQYTAVGDDPAQVQQRLDQLEAQLSTLAGQSLQRGQQLRLDVQHVDMTGSRPRLTLRYTLMAPDGQVAQVHQATVDDPADWVHQSFGPLRP